MQPEVTTRVKDWVSIAGRAVSVPLTCRVLALFLATLWRVIKAIMVSGAFFNGAWLLIEQVIAVWLLVLYFCRTNILQLLSFAWACYSKCALKRILSRQTPRLVLSFVL